jgi:hypothetical protein
MTPEQLAKCNSEHAHQVALFAWAALNFPKYPELHLMFAIPNGGERDVRVASNLRAEGVKAGVPDIFLPVSRGGFHGLFIELKRPTTQGKKRGNTTKEQDQWMAALYANHYATRVCIGWEQARDTIIQYMELKNA